MPKKVAVIATCLKTGASTTFSNMSEAARLGGFDYSCLCNCVRGRQESHAGHRFVAVSANVFTPPKGRILEVCAKYNAGMKIGEIAEQLAIKYRSVNVHVMRGRRIGLITRGMAA